MFIIDALVYLVKRLYDGLKFVYNYFWNKIKVAILKQAYKEAKNATDKDFEDLRADVAAFDREYAEFLKRQRDE
jgi:hypothetical protein